MFDINTVIKEFNLDTNEVASLLFPNAKYKKQAFDRVLKYESTINVDQLAKLAEYLGVSVESLFIEDHWKGIREDGHMTIVKGGYKVSLNHDNFYYTLYFGDKVVDRFLVDTANVKISDFILTINNLINTYEHEHHSRSEHQPV